jgi:large subunit ribosomal protein L10
MAKVLRERIVHELAKRYSSIDCCVFVNFNGLSSQAMSQLRAELKRKRVVLIVQKNSLLRLALKEAAKPSGEEIFTSPTAAVYGTDSPFELCRVAIDSKRKSDKLKIKGGFLQGDFLTEREVAVLSEIPSREALLGRVAGVVISPAARIAFCLVSVLSRTATVLKAYSEVLREKTATAVPAKETQDQVPGEQPKTEVPDAAAQTEKLEKSQKEEPTATEGGQV